MLFSLGTSRTHHPIHNHHKQLGVIKSDVLLFCRVGFATRNPPKPTTRSRKWWASRKGWVSLRETHPTTITFNYTPQTI